jgi:hypothetical protein
VTLLVFGCKESACAGASLLPTAWALTRPTCKNHLGRARTRRSHCWSHNFQGSMPFDAVPSSRAPTTFFLLLPPLFKIKIHDF